jgi:hypothetical protein
MYAKRRGFGILRVSMLWRFASLTPCDRLCFGQSYALASACCTTTGVSYSSPLIQHAPAISPLWSKSEATGTGIRTFGDRTAPSFDMRGENGEGDSRLAASSQARRITSDARCANPCFHRPSRQRIAGEILSLYQVEVS